MPVCRKRWSVSCICKNRPDINIEFDQKLFIYHMKSILYIKHKNIFKILCKVSIYKTLMNDIIILINVIDFIY